MPLNYGGEVEVSTTRVSGWGKDSTTGVALSHLLTQVVLTSFSSLTAHQAAQPPLSVVFGHGRWYNLHMPKEEADDKDKETERGEHEEKSKEQQSTSEEDREKRKLPEPPGNLRRRAEWFKKRH